MTPVSTTQAPQHCPTPRELDDIELLATRPVETAGAVELVDPEGLPLARVTVPGGAVEPLTHAQFGPYRRLYLAPAQAREQYAGRTFVPVTDALTETQLARLAGEGPLALLALVGHGTPDL